LAFAAGSALCGLAWGLNSLVAFRIVQAIPGGLLPSITLTILYRIVPQDRLGAAMGLYGLGVVFAPAVGPTLGGYLVEYVDWRLIFFINVPIGILGVVAAVLVLPGFPGRAGRRFDVLGFLTVAGGLFALLLAISKGESWGWDSYRVLGLITFSALSLTLFVVIELEVTDPILDVRIFRYWAFSHSLMLIAVVMVVMYGVLFYIPYFLQQVQGLGALEAGLILLPQALVMAVLMPIAGWVYDQIGPRWPAAIGLTIAAIGAYLLHTITMDHSREHILWLLVLQGVGVGIAFMPIFTGGLAVIPLIRVNAASAFNNVVQRVSGALGLAVLTSIFITQQAQQMAGRAALLPANAAIPDLGPTAPRLAGPYAVYRLTQMQVFVGAMDYLLLVVAALRALGALSALLLRTGSAPSASAGFVPPQQETASTAPADDGGPIIEDGPVEDGAVECDLVPSATAANDGDDKVNASPRDT
jgi:EmrB/QacA subfamily drug resistance transporter